MCLHKEGLFWLVCIEIECNSVLTMQEMRNKIADFMETDEVLNQLPAFQAQKIATLSRYPSHTWHTYLQELRKPKIIWGMR